MTRGRSSHVVLSLVAVALAASTSAVAARGDPDEALTKADQARAKRMLLRAADLAPGFVPLSSPQPDVYCRAADESDLTISGKARTPQHTLVDANRLFVIASAARLYRDTRDANTSWRRGTSPAGVRCVGKLVAATPGAVLRSFRKQPFPRLAPRTVAYRAVVDLRTARGTLRTHTDVIVLQRGRAQAVLSILSGGRPLVRSETLSFARTIARRVTAAMRGA